MTPTAARRSPAVLLALAALVTGALSAFLGLALAPGARAEAAGKLTLASATGSVTDNPPFASVTTAQGCPSDYAARISLKIVKPGTTTETSLASVTTAGAPFTGPINWTLPAWRSIETALGGPATDGDYEIRLKCHKGLSDMAPGWFSSTITVTGTTWTLKPDPAVSTSTELTADPAGSAVAGSEVKLEGKVTPDTAAGTLAFHDGATKLGEAAVASGKAAFKTTALAAGAHSLTATFTPADTTAYTGSVSAAQTYTITEPGGDPSDPPEPSDTGTPTDDPTEPAGLEATDEDGEPLGENPVLTPEQKVLLTARGYTADATVKVTLSDSEEAFEDATADPEGTVEAYAFTVPKGLADGSYTLTLAEEAAKGTDEEAPHSAEFAFTVGEASPTPDPSDTAGADGGATGGSDSGGTGTDGGASTGGSGSGGGTGSPLASTGSIASTVGLAAIVLTGLGAAFVRYGRRVGLQSFGGAQEERTP
ncbi:Ig-like domain-containing protein [Streptomyces pathocidini]|uniref:Ig-like domain-containing protein n=1 Tax=Streptomyces pathocidini TaxID=1650571 RepID=A0ABW7USK1_9ACTN|nr:Ig-like domain-containing protein [Streptomyces pathocidini]